MVSNERIETLREQGRLKEAAQEGRAAIASIALQPGLGTPLGTMRRCDRL